MAVACVGLAACTSGSDAEGGGGGCVSSVVFRGQSYFGYHAMVRPVPGEVLGEGVIPGCDDTGDGIGSPPDESISVAELPGVDPSVAVTEHEAPATIFVREGVDPLPDEIKRFLHAPACDPRDAPITLRGPWLGILGADGDTEVDLTPPYDITMLAEHASTPSYERAELTIRVPASLGRPIRRDDLRTSLWEGGKIAVTAGCSGEGYLADYVEAFPA
jgi:hypothetical protein